MPVSYVGAIRSVLDTYPPSKGLFREILQNSEDAKATKQIFVLDRRTFGTNVIADHENLIPSNVVQAPALLAYNDSVFTDSDFKSLFNLWDSSKKADTSKIGKFGMGFRSTFHISDTPQVLSQSTLAILDPLNKNGSQTDIRIELDTAEKRASIIDYFALHLFEPNVVSSGPTMFQGTVVRLPFRKIPSEISTKVFSAPDIHQLLLDFVQDEIRIALLFLSNVSSIEILEISPDHQVTCLAKSSTNRQTSTILGNISVPSCTASFADLTETTEVKHEPQPTQRWRVLRTSFPLNAASSELTNRLGFNAANALAQHKLHPTLAIAVKLSILDKLEPTIGRLFTYLPLPLFTRFCVHVQGLFALTPSREKLQNREEMPAHGTDYHISVEWNKLLFEEYLPQAWMCLLSMLTESRITNIFDAWPPPQKPNQLGDSGYWEKLPHNLVEIIIKSKCSVWPVFGSPGEFHELVNVLVAGDGEQDELLDALAVCGLYITRPPTFIVDLLKAWNAKFLTPAVAHSSLLGLKDTLASDALQDQLPVVLKYLLSTGKLENIVNLPIVSTPNGRRIALTRRPNSGIIHVLLERSEYDLFKACDASTISLAYIDTHLADLLRQNGPSILNVELLTPAAVIGYLENHPVLKLALGTGMEPGTIAWISNFWLWMRDWRSSRQLYPSLDQLLLLPTQDGLKPTRSLVFESTRIHPLLLSPLKQLRVPVLHQAFGPNSAARSALSTFKVFSDVRNIDNLLDALDLDTLKSFTANEEIARQLASHISSCRPTALSDERRRKLRALPIFLSHPLTSTQGRIHIPDGCAVFAVKLRDLRFLPVLEETIILDGSQPGVSPQAVDPNTRGVLSDLDVLRLCLSQFRTQPKTIQQAVVGFMASNRRKVPGELIEILGTTSFVAVGDGSERSPREIVNPLSPLQALYDVDSCFSVHRSLGGSKLIDDLCILNLMQSALSPGILKERIRHITTTQNHDCARELVRVIHKTRFELPQIDDIYGKWLPTSRGLLDPRHCRDDPHHRRLFDRVLSSLDHDLKTDHFFRVSLGWDQPIPVAILSQQLRFTLIAAQDDAYDVVCDIVKELMERKLSDEEILRLKNVVAGYKWVPVLGETPLVRSEHAVFLNEDRLAGFYQIVFPGSKSKNFFIRMGCSERPSTAAILDRLSELQGEAPSVRVVKKAYCLLSLLSDDEVLKDDRSRVFVPDSSCTLRPLHSVLYNDIGERAVLVNLSDDEYLAHGMIHESLAKSLQMNRLGLKYIDLKPLGIDMGEELTTTIRNKLRSYTPRQILIEFFANAADAGATEFGILIDETTLSSNRILFSPLAEVSDSPSLVLYNDAVFTAADFDGICQTGIGGKSNRRDSIGQFGFGALTMFHLTDFAMIISGNYVLFIEPTKQLLPIRGRATLLIPLQHVKQMYPDHIKPFDGIFGFEASSTNNYQGTLFRLPLRRHAKKSSLGEAWDIPRLREVLIQPFEDHAEEFLLFTSIGTIMINRRTSFENICTRRISSDPKEEVTVNEFKTKVFDVTIHSDREYQSIETQSWHVVSTLTFKQQDIPESLSKYKLRSPIALAIAARTDAKTDAKRKRKPVYKFFSSLPLISGHLPVHVSAPFILSDDRRQIRLDNLDPAAADYNRWLLSTAIPPLYLFLLSDLLEHDHDNVTWWPGGDHEENELTHLMTSAFYGHLKDSHQRIFLPSYRVEATPLTSKEVLVASHVTNKALDKVFRLLQPPLVLLPSRLLRKAHDVGLTELTPTYVSDLVRQTSVNPAQCLQFEELKEVLSFLGQPNTDNLLGLSLLPLSSGEFGMIESAKGASETYFIAPESVHALFPASRHLIDAKFEPPLFLWSPRTFNVEQFTGSSLKHLIATVLEEGSVALHDNDKQAWIASFWNKCAYMKVNLASTSTFPLVPTSKLRLYTSIDNCQNRSTIILSTRHANAWLWSMLSYLGLTVVERYSENFPRYLRDHAILENLRDPKTLIIDILTAMASIQHNIIDRFADLDVRFQKLFADWCRKELESVRSIPNNLLTFTKRLPIWPVAQLDGLLVYCSADGVKMLPPGISADLARRFLNTPSTPYSIAFRTLQKDALSLAAFFGSLGLPQVLSETDVLPYKNLLTMFLNHSQSISSFETLRVPDANFVLRHPRELYARDPLFLAAFEGSPVFILDAFANMEPRFYTFGMKRQVDLDINMFTACARALHNDSVSSDLDPERARIVFEAYCEVLPLRILSYSRHLWSTLDNIRFIPRDPSRRKSSAPPNLAPAAYAKQLPAIVSPNELMLARFEPILWTQRAHFLHPPGERIHIANPSFGHPSFPDVVEHLRILAMRILQDFPSSPRLRYELTETYKWLNANCEDKNNADQLVGLHNEPLFLNLADSEDLATREWYTADQLLLNETKAVSRFYPVNGFLLQFQKLLRATGVKAVVHPNVPPLSEDASDSEQLASIRKTFHEMRQAKLLTDVKFVTDDNDDGEEENRILPCHRTFLATYSSFFYDAFTNEMESTNFDASVCNPKIMNVIGYSSRCVSYALDFAYTGIIDDACTGDLDLMLELLTISDFWQMDRLHKETQRLIVSKKLINIETCQEIEEVAQTYQASFLSQQCLEYRKQNKQLM